MTPVPVPRPRRVPVATYRVQVHAGLPLEMVTARIPYLKSLGISHVYTSSLLTAKPGSTHGYDVCDHGRLNPDVGSPEQFATFTDRLRDAGMGLILDVVPNHMSVHESNAWWADVLENGPSSPYAGSFDIVWNDHPREHLRGKVLLPILGRPYGEALDGGAIRLTFGNGAFAFDLDGQRLPIDPRTYGLVLDELADAARDRVTDESAQELQSIATAVRYLPPRTESDPARVEEGRRETAVVKRRLKDLATNDPVVAETIRLRLDRLAADPASLDRLLDAQAYRPCYWRVASDEINYRRFFDVNDLAALSTEKEAVFRDVHRLIFEWMREGRVQGLRIDHPDGLFDPKQYLDRLRESAPRAAPDEPPYVVVEKILGPDEVLRPDWATDGTTGYEFINAANGLFVDETAKDALSAFYDRWTGREESFDDTVYRKKFLVLQSSMTSELHVLAGELDRLAQSDRGSRDFTLNGLRHTLREVLCHFPIYRTYGNGGLTEVDRSTIRFAVWRARRRNPLLGRDLFDFLRDTLQLKDPKSGPATPEYRAAQAHFLGKFQQLSAPLMAKGFEDTALYIDNRLTSLNEVGGDPRRFGRTPADLHAALKSRPPGGLSPLSTHDTKRGEDVRARINVLSEWAEEWETHVRSWSTANRSHRVELEGGVIVPDANEEYLLYQTLIGTWPSAGVTEEYGTRIREYVLKAVHEAKVHSSWINPDTDYDEALLEFVRRILDPRRSPDFHAEFVPFQSRVRRYGALNSLSQSLIRCTAPGVPDLYQGTEFFDDCLVDPDNRRPVDFDERARCLAELDAGPMPDLHADFAANRAKLFVVSRALRCRGRDPDLFERGAYVPVDIAGERTRHAFAFLRADRDRAVLTVVPRLPTAVFPAGGTLRDLSGWVSTTLAMPPEWASRTWVSEWSGDARRFGAAVSLADVFSEGPVALLRTGF